MIVTRAFGCWQGEATATPAAPSTGKVETGRDTEVKKEEVNKLPTFCDQYAHNCPDWISREDQHEDEDITRQ